jgi:hypothetical protein
LGLGCGTLFELKGGTYKVLHQFCPTGIASCPDGGVPQFGNLLLDQAANVFGTTFLGGTHGYGTVWEYTP